MGSGHQKRCCLRKMPWRQRHAETSTINCCKSAEGDNQSGTCAVIERNQRPTVRPPGFPCRPACAPASAAGVSPARSGAFSAKMEHRAAHQQGQYGRGQDAAPITTCRQCGCQNWCRCCACVISVRNRGRRPGGHRTLTVAYSVTAWFESVSFRQASIQINSCRGPPPEQGRWETHRRRDRQRYPAAKRPAPVPGEAEGMLRSLAVSS